jgi:hypothetical protein
VPYAIVERRAPQLQVRDAADVQAAPPPPIDEYLSNSTVGSDDEAPAARRAPSKVVALRHMRLAMGKISASRAAATITETQTAEAKKKKRKRTRPTESVDMATVSSSVETIEVNDEDGDAESPGAIVALSTGTPCRAVSTEEQTVEMPRRMSATEERPRSSADTVRDLESHKKVRKVPPKPCKPGLRSATK